jgi:hypothetical protein
MSRKVIEVSGTAEIAIAECAGDLRVRSGGPGRVEIVVDGDPAVSTEVDGITFSAIGDCQVVCPAGSCLDVGHVRGDLRINGLSGRVSAESVSGDVSLRGVGSTTLGTVAGDVRGRGLGSDLRATNVAGDCYLRGVAGDVALTNVGGDLSADGLGAGLHADTVGADVRLGPPFVAGATYRVSAGGGLRLSVPHDASLQLAIRSGGPIRSRVTGLELSEGGEGVLGAGEATLDADVGGTVRIRLVESEAAFVPVDLPDLSGIGDMIEAEIAGAMAGVEAHVAKSLGAINSDEIRKIYESQAERMLRRTQDFARREGRRAERLAEQARLRAERAERRWRRASGQPARPKPASVSDDERMQILRMVEAGKVSPQEASDLLAALEGR